MLTSLDTETIAQQTERYTIEIFLNVYDVTQTPGDPKSTVVRLNKITRDFNLGGVFHGAIQIGAGTPGTEPIEFSFGWCQRGTGVYVVHARQNPMYQYRETLSLGLTPKTMAEVKEVIQQFKLSWQGPTYDLLTRNCCHFCEDLAAQLEVQPVPGWLNRFASGAAATVSMTQETVKTIHDIGQELGRLSGESLSFIKASFAKAASVASQQQQQLAMRLQRDSQAAPAAGVAGGAVGSRSTPQLQAAAATAADGEHVEDYYGQQRKQQQRRVVSDADIVIHGSGGSSRAGTAWLGRFQSVSSITPSALSRDDVGSSSTRGTGYSTSSAAAAGQNLLAGVQQAGRQLKATTSKLGLKLSQTVQQAAQQQQQNAAAQDSWEAAGGQQQAACTMQQQQQLHQQHSGGGLVPAAQPKLAAQYRVDSADQVSDPLASLLLSDDDDLEFKSVTSGGSEVASALASSRETSGGCEPATAAAQPTQHLLD